MADDRKQINLRASKKMIAEWKASASASGLSLNQWIIFKCQGVVLVRTETKVA